MKKRAIAVASFLALSLIHPDAGFASARSGAEATCRALADLRIEDTNLLSAAVVAADDELPEYCRVLGYVRPAINFEIRLPTSNWNGKFYMAGCGGWCGKLESENPASQFINSINYGLRRGYAVSTTDGGHWGEHLFDGRWAYYNRVAEIDYGYRAGHETARVTKVIIDAYFGGSPARSYFGGCSGGGRQGVMHALRFPDDFDGIIAYAPGLDLTGAMMLAAWVARANTEPDGRNLIGPAEVRLIREAVYSACDRLDGVEDGLISDPRACRFDPSTIACGPERSSNCLTEAQLDALRAIYGGPRDGAARQLYPGVTPGSEPYWEFWFTGQTLDPHDDLVRMVSEQFLRYMAFEDDPGEHYEVGDFDFDRDPARLEFMGRLYNATSPDLDAFRERGGKLLMLQGWADPVVPAGVTIAYYEAVEERIGGGDATQDFFRLFLLPGTDHCGIGEGPGVTDAGLDPLEVLERWVEQGEAPASIATTKTDSDGNVLWTRPICPYPQREVHDGRGDVNAAKSWHCGAP
jgi:hypothetical protein